eukprot:g1053.t1
MDSETRPLLNPPPRSIISKSNSDDTNFDTPFAVNASQESVEDSHVHILSNGKESQETSSDNFDIPSPNGTYNHHRKRGSVRKNIFWTVCIFILGCELCERLAFYGISTNLVSYLHDFLGLKQGSADQATNLWTGSCYLTSLIGAILADECFGRYRTILLFSGIYLVGMLVLTVASFFLTSLDDKSLLLTSSVTLPSSTFGLRTNSSTNGAFLPQKTKPSSNTSVSSFGSAMFYLSLVVIAIGTGGIKPNVSPFGADQFSDTPEDEVEKARFFNYFYWAINIGALIASLVIVQLQTHVSWTLGFFVPALAMGIALFCFYLGTPRYRKKRFDPASKKNSILNAFRVFAQAVGRMICRGPFTLSRSNGSMGTSTSSVRRRNPPHWIRRAEISFGGSYSTSMVSGVIALWNLRTVFLCSVMYWAVYSQMASTFVTQGKMMDRRIPLPRWFPTNSSYYIFPAATLSSIDTIALILLIPLFEKVIYPFLKSRNINFHVLLRIAVGFVFAAIAMFLAAFVEYERRKVSTIVNNGTDPNHRMLFNMDRITIDGWSEGTFLVAPPPSPLIRSPGEVPGEVGSSPTPTPSHGADPDNAPIQGLSVMYQIPQYFFIGISEVLASIGQLEYFYDFAPKSMKSSCMGLQLLSVAFGGYASSLILALIPDNWISEDLDKGHLDYFFYLLGILMVANTIIFTVFMPSSIPPSSANDEDTNNVDNNGGKYDDSKSNYGGVHSGERIQRSKDTPPETVNPGERRGLLADRIDQYAPIEIPDEDDIKSPPLYRR